MIEKLTVQDVAVVESADIAFGPGLNVVTGETGAGKSVLIGAIDLLCGGRADHALVRQGAQQSAVMAEIVLPSEAEAAIAPLSGRRHRRLRGRPAHSPPNHLAAG